MNKDVLGQWKWGVFAAIAITILTILPQISLWSQTGGIWQGSYVLLHTDEVAYSAYINALIDGRNRRNDPYTGRDNQAEAPQGESLFSIQFAPAYVIAIPARILGLSASSAFIWLTVISSFFTTISIFWLIKSITGDSQLAAAGAIFVLCFGAFAASYGEIRVYLGEYLGQGAGLIAIPFTRRYQPAATFPIFFYFCGFIWHALNSIQQRLNIILAVAAGLSFVVLIFSYFYLWTAAAAWLVSLALLSFIFRRGDWKRHLVLFLTVGVFAVIGLALYLMMLSERHKSLDETQAIAFSHLPNIFRFCEIIGVLLVAIILYGVWRRFIILKDYVTLVTLSFAILPVIVFNQQIITGVSLQPIHYELYIANYVVLIGVVITILLISQKPLKQSISNRILSWVAIISVSWGFIEVTGLMKRSNALNKMREESMSVANRLKAITNVDNNAVNNINSPPSVLAANVEQADLLPTIVPQAVLWSPHISVFSGLKPGEGKERFYQYLYFSGVNEKELAEAIGKNQFEVMAAIFGYDRALPALVSHSLPISNEEKLEEIRRFSEYKAKFSRDQAAQYNLSYIITSAEENSDFSNLDRWFERDAGELINKWKLYRVKLRR